MVKIILIVIGIFVSAIVGIWVLDYVVVRIIEKNDKDKDKKRPQR